MKKILFVASESVPFIKTGGLADVVGSLPKSFPKEEFDVRVVYLETKLKDVYYNKDGKKYSLKEYIKTIDDVKEITSLLEDYRSYDDGGSQLFSSKEYDLSILICNKINGTSDIYIGDSNMTYSGTMCK